ncbi:MAG: hypothetical protein Q8909_04450 [Bacteroidota bacterium]|nr:hypothetical protein [Bacteroidota bacterium]
MKMKTKIYIAAITLLVCVGGFAQTKSEVLAKGTADSTRFAINKKAGWQQYASYLTPVAPDSVMLETVLQHDKTIDWTQEQYIGKIKAAVMMPKASRTASFNLLSNTYQLRVEPNGKCYLQLTSGSLPDGDPAIVPVRVVYKK